MKQIANFIFIINIVFIIIMPSKICAITLLNINNTANPFTDINPKNNENVITVKMLNVPIEGWNVIMNDYQTEIDQHALVLSKNNRSLFTILSVPERYADDLTHFVTKMREKNIRNMGKNGVTLNLKEFKKIIFLNNEAIKETYLSTRNTSNETNYVENIYFLYDKDFYSIFYIVDNNSRNLINQLSLNESLDVHISKKLNPNKQTEFKINNIPEDKKKKGYIDIAKEASPLSLERGPIIGDVIKGTTFEKDQANLAQQAYLNKLYSPVDSVDARVYENSSWEDYVKYKDLKAQKKKMEEASPKFWTLDPVKNRSWYNVLGMLWDYTKVPRVYIHDLFSEDKMDPVNTKEYKSMVKKYIDIIEPISSYAPKVYQNEINKIKKIEYSSHPLNLVVVLFGVFLGYILFKKARVYLKFH